MTGKERIGRLLQRLPADRVGLFEVFWTETARRWSAEGHFPSPELAEDHFNLDLRRCRALNLVASLEVGEVVSDENDTTRRGLAGGRARGSFPSFSIQTASSNRCCPL